MLLRRSLGAQFSIIHYEKEREREKSVSKELKSSCKWHYSRLDSIFFVESRLTLWRGKCNCMWCQKSQSNPSIEQPWKIERERERDALTMEQENRKINCMKIYQRTKKDTVVAVLG